MKVKDIISKFREELVGIYSFDELDQILFLVLESELKFKRTDLVLQADRKLHIHESLRLNEILGNLQRGMPLQYVLGHAWFDGMKFYVNQDVLIPRQETEELVNWIHSSILPESSTAYGKCLDIGTGSGCIAISLKKRMHFLSVTGLDISEKAIAVASKNSKDLGVPVSWCVGDILHWEKMREETPMIRDQEFDVIVSNPPYVMQAEKSRMESRVTDFEPHSALFVSDADPLIFYRKISEFAFHTLKAGAYLYFEINEAKGEDVTELMEKAGFQDIEVRKDLQEKNRMVRARKV
ncbi:MAG: peptide chain release factor N(5)-glutamine methyltransferase [Bacteroidetes bacterium]|nr:peptide chain release factor N(5)-glutamine methyltransferase [Bacteroidota bacterium]